jgi:hypothetical protein
VSNPEISPTVTSTLHRSTFLATWDPELGAKVRASFVASDRTYGARRVRKDMLAEIQLGVTAGRPLRRGTWLVRKRYLLGPGTH